MTKEEEDIIALREKRLSEARKDEVALRELQNSAGWKILVDSLTVACHSIEHRVLMTPAGGMDEVLKQEHLKGRLVILRQLLQGPAELQKQARDLIDLYNKVEKSNGDAE